MPGPCDPPGPLLIVGCQRSGTTLLRAMLNAHPGICIGYECDFFEKLAPGYADLVDLRPVLPGFLSDLLQVERFAFWSLSRKDLEQAFAGQRGPLSYRDAVLTVAGCYRRHRKPAASLIGFKNPNSIQRLGAFFTLFPNARVVHIQRDPRGVLASELNKQQKAGPTNRHLHTVRVARRYNRARAAAHRFRDDPRFHTLLYEELITDPMRALAPVCTWLGLVADPAVLTYATAADTPTEELWQHGRTLQAPDPGRGTAYRSDLSPTEIAGIERLCSQWITDAEAGASDPSDPVKVGLFLALGRVCWISAGSWRKPRHWMGWLADRLAFIYRAIAIRRAATASGATRRKASG